MFSSSMMRDEGSLEAQGGCQPQLGPALFKGNRTLTGSCQLVTRDGI